MKKTGKKTSEVPDAYILDTTTLLNFSHIVARMKPPIVVPSPVLRELDRLKNNPDEAIAKNARKASQVLEARQKKPGNILIVETAHTAPPENPVISVALTVRRDGKYNPVVVTADNAIIRETERAGISVIPPEEALVRARDSGVTHWLLSAVELFLYMLLLLVLPGLLLAAATVALYEDAQSWVWVFIYCIFAQVILLWLYAATLAIIDMIRSILIPVYLPYSKMNRVRSIDLTAEPCDSLSKSDSDVVYGLLGLPGYPGYPGWSSYRDSD